MNVSKLNQKNFLRIVSFVCALPFLSFSILTSAEKPRLPNTFKVFKVAVIGSDVRDTKDVGSVQDIKMDVEGTKGCEGAEGVSGIKCVEDVKCAGVFKDAKAVKDTKDIKCAKVTEGNKDARDTKSAEDTKIIEDIDCGVEHSLNRFTVGKLCSCELGKKLSEYEGVTVKDGEIELYKNYPVKVSKNSIFVDIDGGRESVVLSFYNVKSCDEAKNVIPECQFAICPFFANLNEIGNGLEEHLTRLRDFVKKYNEMCDVRFLYYTNNIESSDGIATYCQNIGRLCKRLYTNQAKLQQDIQSHQLSLESGYEECVSSILYWRKQRAIEFERCIKKEVISVDRFKVLEKIKTDRQAFVDDAKIKINNFLDRNNYSGYEKLYSEIFKDGNVINRLNESLNISAKRMYDEEVIKKELGKKLKIAIKENGMDGPLIAIKDVGVFDHVTDFFNENFMGDSATICEKIFCSRCNKSMYSLIYYLIKSYLIKSIDKESGTFTINRKSLKEYVVKVTCDALKNCFYERICRS